MRNCPRWWLTVDSDNPTTAARPPVVSDPTALVSSNDINFTRAGSANAFSRNATSKAAASSTGPAATGAQHTGADMSTMGNVFGIHRFWPQY